jgi:hypothetical protein
LIPLAFFFCVISDPFRSGPRRASPGPPIGPFEEEFRAAETARHHANG